MEEGAGRAASPTYSQRVKARVGKTGILIKA